MIANALHSPVGGMITMQQVGVTFSSAQRDAIHKTKTGRHSWHEISLMTMAMPRRWAKRAFRNSLNERAEIEYMRDTPVNYQALLRADAGIKTGKAKSKRTHARRMKQARRK